MIGTRSALLAASLFVTVPAIAAPPPSGQYIWVPAGDAVVVVPKTPARQIDFPVVDIFARQEAMMQRMMADMDTMMAMPMPSPAQMIQSVMQGMPQVAPGSSVVMTSISTGSGTCSQTITYDYPVNGGQPLMKVASTGNACGVIHSTGPIQVTQPVPAPQPLSPQPQRQQHERLWTIGYPPHAITTGTPPRT